MSIRNNLFSVLIVALVSAVSSAEVAADRLAGDINELNARMRPNPCTTHARLMSRACSADRTDDFLVHLADCIYVTSPEDELDCRADASEESAKRLKSAMMCLRPVSSFANYWVKSALTLTLILPSLCIPTTSVTASIRIPTGR